MLSPPALRTAPLTLRQDDRSDPRLTPTPGSGRVHSTELNDQYVVLLENVPEQVVYHWLASGGGSNPARRSAATECLPPRVSDSGIVGPGSKQWLSRREEACLQE